MSSSSAFPIVFANGLAATVPHPDHIGRLSLTTLVAGDSKQLFKKIGVTISPILNENNVLEIQFSIPYNEPVEGHAVELKPRSAEKGDKQSWKIGEDGVITSLVYPHLTLGFGSLGVVTKGGPADQAFGRPGTCVVILANKSDVNISVTVQGTSQNFEVAARGSTPAQVPEGSVLEAVSSPPGTFVSPPTKRILGTETVTYTVGLNLADPSHVDLIRSWLPCKSFSLLYKYPGNDYTSQEFNRLCANQGPTLVIITSQKGNIFGGYNADDWGGILGIRGCYCNSNTFLFTLKNPANIPPLKLPRMTTCTSSEADPNLHVCFGSSSYVERADLWLRPGSPSVSSLSGFYPSVNNPHLLDGAQLFDVKEVSVYKVTHVCC